MQYGAEAARCVCVCGGGGGGGGGGAGREETLYIGMYMPEYVFIQPVE